MGYLPTYKKWGGDGHSAGVDCTGSLTEEQKKVPGDDPLDELFKTHDLAYDAVNKLDYCKKQQAILAADWALVAGMARLEISPLDVFGLTYRAAATTAFWAKILNVDTPNQVPCEVEDLLKKAQTFVRPPPPRRDPLALDLNGNGLETVGLSDVASLLFDHNADGVKTSTGWISANDGLLVWDRNGNGTIDNGRELFGDATVKSDGTLATGGFNALADLDANGDGIVNALDANFSNLRVWRDLNQDGVSEAGEISTLDTYQIAGINIANTTANTALGNGNTLNETGSYVRADGTTGLAGNINLASNSFYSQFTDALPPTAAIQALPDMRGAGMVRGLRDAAGRSAQLEATLVQYAAATCDVQKTMLDNVIGQWSATSTLFTTAARIPAATFSSGTSVTSVTLEGIVTGSPAYAAFMDKLSVVERFCGENFQVLPSDPNTTLSYTILSAQQAANDAVFEVRRVG
jgi:hypothetical protein